MDRRRTGDVQRGEAAGDQSPWQLDVGREAHSQQQEAKEAEAAPKGSNLPTMKAAVATRDI